MDRSVKAAELSRARNLMLGNSRIARVLAIAVLVILTITWLVPFAWAISTAFKTELQAQRLPLEWIPPEGFTFEQFATVLERGDVVKWMINTLIVATIVTVVTVLICALAGYAFSRTVFRGRNWLFAFTIAVILIPAQLLMVPLFQQMVAFRAVDTFAGIILPQLVAPTMVFIFKKFFDQIPQEVEDAARVDGASQWRIFSSIVMPISRPIVSAVSIFVFIGAWNNFMWPFIVTNDPDLMTLPVGLATVENAYGIVYAQLMASALVAAVPLIVMFMLFQSQIIKAVATTGLGGQ